MNHLFTLSDGRNLQYADNGVASAAALVFHHGTTCSNECWQMWMDSAAAKGVRAIAINRPGVDASTRLPGRRVINDIQDLKEVLSHLAITKIVAIGWSGGGARALGSSLVDGCVSIHTLAGIANVEEGYPDSMSGVSEEHYQRVLLMRDSYEELLANRSQSYDDDMALTPEIALEFLSESQNFKKFEDEYKIFSSNFSSSVVNALKNGAETDADDYFANYSPWGFSIDDISIPVTMWHGVKDDGVPIQRSQYLERRLSNGKLHTLEDQDHVSIMVEYRNEVLAAAISDLSR
jgi:pimeloyl-ACP methyl ester carboxylesterase